MPKIKLQSSDGEVFQVDFEIAKVSGIIKTMVENLGLEEEDEEIVPLLKVNTRILKKIIEWATYHKDDPPPTEVNKVNGRRGRRSDDISSWDADFLNVDNKTLCELISAANYLEIHNLMEAGCKTIANMIKGKSAEQIRQTLNIKNDFPAAEEKQVKK